MTKQTYLKSVDKLLDAYNNGKLFHGSCDACAVGTLLETDAWVADFYTDGFAGITRVKNVDYAKYHCITLGITMKELSNHLFTIYREKGFTRRELMVIERAFEMAIFENRVEYLIEREKEGQYLGLVAVLKVMEEMIEEETGDRGYIEEGSKRLNSIAKEKYCLTI